MRIGDIRVLQTPEAIAVGGGHLTNCALAMRTHAITFHIRRSPCGTQAFTIIVANIGTFCVIICLCDNNSLSLLLITRRYNHAEWRIKALYEICVFTKEIIAQHCCGGASALTTAIETL